MKKVFVIILTILSINSFGQQWIKYNIDSILTLTIPDNYQIVDTMGQTVIQAQVNSGFIVVGIIPNKGQIEVNIKNEIELLDFYKGFQNGFLGSQKGELINGKIIENNGLKMTRFAYKVMMGDENQTRHCLGIFINDKLYVINFWELEPMSNETSKMRESLFSSLIFSGNLTVENQMSN